MLFNNFHILDVFKVKLDAKVQKYVQTALSKLLSV